MELAEMDIEFPEQSLSPPSVPARTPAGSRRRLTLSRNSDTLPRNWNGGQDQQEEGGSCSIGQEGLSNGDGSNNDNGSYTRSSLFISLRGLRKSLGTADAKFRTFARDHFLYKLTLISAYLAFSVMFGILLAFLVHSKPFGRRSNTGGELQTDCDLDLPMNSSSSANLTDSQKLGKMYLYLDQLVERQVDRQCDHYRKEWGASLELRLKNAQCSERVQVLEDEISSLRQQFSDKLAQKQEDLNRLIKAVNNFREGHFTFRKSTVDQVFKFVWNLGLWGGPFSYIAYRVYVHYYQN